MHCYLRVIVVDDTVRKKCGRVFTKEKAVDELEAKFCKVYSNALGLSITSSSNMYKTLITNPKVNKLSVLKTLNRLKSTDDYKNLELESREYKDPRGAGFLGMMAQLSNLTMLKIVLQGKLSQAGYALFALKEIPSNNDYLPKVLTRLRVYCQLLLRCVELKQKFTKKQKKLLRKPKTKLMKEQDLLTLHEDDEQLPT